MMPKMNSSRHSHTQKIRILRLLERNNFNYNLTSKQNGIARPTIKRWEKLYGREVFGGKSPTAEALAEVDIELKINDVNVIRNLYTLRKRTLSRVMKMAENETKLESLLNVLKFVSGELQKFSELDKPEGDSATNFVEYITKLMLENSTELPSKDFIEQ
jgi:transposase-like protein